MINRINCIYKKEEDFVVQKSGVLSKGAELMIGSLLSYLKESCTLISNCEFCYGDILEIGLPLNGFVEISLISTLVPLYGSLYSIEVSMEETDGIEDFDPLFEELDRIGAVKLVIKFTDGKEFGRSSSLLYQSQISQSYYVVHEKAVLSSIIDDWEDAISILNDMEDSSNQDSVDSNPLSVASEIITAVKEINEGDEEEASKSEETPKGVEEVDRVQEAETEGSVEEDLSEVSEPSEESEEVKETSEEHSEEQLEEQSEEKLEEISQDEDSSDGGAVKEDSSELEEAVESPSENTEEGEESNIAVDEEGNNETGESISPVEEEIEDLGINITDDEIPYEEIFEEGVELEEDFGVEEPESVGNFSRNIPDSIVEEKANTDEKEEIEEDEVGTGLLDGELGEYEEENETVSDEEVGTGLLEDEEYEEGYEESSEQTEIGDDDKATGLLDEAEIELSETGYYEDEENGKDWAFYDVEYDSIESDVIEDKISKDIILPSNISNYLVSEFIQAYSTIFGLLDLERVVLYLESYVDDTDYVVQIGCGDSFINLEYSRGLDLISYKQEGLQYSLSVDKVSQGIEGVIEKTYKTLKGIGSLDISVDSKHWNRGIVFKNASLRKNESLGNYEIEIL